MTEWKRRTDEFKIGDVVEFIDEDPYDGAFMGERHRAKHGRGPYTVEDIETERAPWMRDKLVHPQWVTVNGERYSGAWFKPVRAEAEAAA